MMPYRALRRVALRFDLGAKSHGEHNWRKGHKDPEFRKQCFNHVIEHLFKYATEGNVLDQNLDPAAWGILALIEFEELDGETSNAFQPNAMNDV